MSGEFQLPNELAEVEALLNALAPTPSRIDRDELMYRAGAAAARTQASQRRWLLPTMTAVAAAVLAVAGTLQFAAMSGTPPDEVRRPPDIPTGDALTVVQRRLPDEQSAKANLLPAFRFDFSKAPLLAARERALQFEFDEPPPVLAAGGANTTDRVPSMRRLREEFLPQETDPAMINDEFPWRWLQPWNHMGEAT